MKKLLCLLGLVVLSACGAKADEKTIKVGASPSPHSEILEVIKPILKEEGYLLETVVFNDYIIPNTALIDGELNANFFQHQPYLDFFNENNNSDLVSVGGVHFEPMGIYQGKTSSITNLKEGAKIGIPADATNGARALFLLEKNGLITLKEGKGLETSKLDIVKNDLNLEIIEMEAAIISRNLDSLDLGVINGNYAVSSEILDKLITSEEQTSLAANEFKNILVVNPEDVDSDVTKALYKALTSDEVKEFLEEKYKNIFVAVFE